MCCLVACVQPCIPEDGHNDARNMLSYWFIDKSKLLHQVGLTNHFILFSNRYQVKDAQRYPPHKTVFL